MKDKERGDHKRNVLLRALPKCITKKSYCDQIFYTTCTFNSILLSFLLEYLIFGPKFATPETFLYYKCSCSKSTANFFVYPEFHSNSATDLEISACNIILLNSATPLSTL